MSLATNWIEATTEQLAGKSLSVEEEEAVVNLLEQVSGNPEYAFEVMLQIIEQSPSERVLNCLGAGPIEELLVKYPEYLEKLIANVSNASALKQCLLHVNYEDDEDELNINLLDDFLNSTK